MNNILKSVTFNSKRSYRSICSLLNNNNNSINNIRSTNNLFMEVKRNITKGSWEENMFKKLGVDFDEFERQKPVYNPDLTNVPSDKVKDIVQRILSLNAIEYVQFTLHLQV